MKANLIGARLAIFFFLVTVGLFLAAYVPLNTRVSTRQESFFSKVQQDCDKLASAKQRNAVKQNFSQAKDANFILIDITQVLICIGLTVALIGADVSARYYHLLKRVSCSSGTPERPGSTTPDHI